jgi:hypothetical protein
MARTTLTVQTTAASGIVAAAATAVDQPNGNKFTNDGRTWIEIINGAGTTLTVTFITNGTYNVQAVAYPIADLAPTIAGTTTKVFGPFDKTLFNDSNGDVNVDFSSGTTVTARVFALGTA